MLINLILVVGLYVFVGNSGVFSFGQIGFMAIGAYTAATLRIPEVTKNVLYPTMPARARAEHRRDARGRRARGARRADHRVSP